MNPNHKQIERAAYQRWERRGTRHGNDQEDWVAAEKDLRFAINYRWLARRHLGLTVEPGPIAASPWRCRFCEQAGPSVAFSARPIALPGGNRLAIGDECDDCRTSWESLVGQFERFARPFLASHHASPGANTSVPIAALKTLVRLGLSQMPVAELHHFGDTVEWVANPDHSRDARNVAALGLGCYVYLTPEPLPTAFLSLARRSHDEVHSPYPYALTFLGLGRVVFQTHLPFCPRDEEIETDLALRGPVLSMSLGRAEGLRESAVAVLPLEPGKAKLKLDGINRPQAEFPHEMARSASPMNG